MKICVFHLIERGAPILGGPRNDQLTKFVVSPPSITSSTTELGVDLNQRVLGISMH